MLTAIIFFAPVSVYFAYLLMHGSLATFTDWIVGVILGVAFNVIGILKLIDWLKDENTQYISPKGFCYLPSESQKLSFRLFFLAY